MGQHHVLVNVDSREFVRPAGLGLGAKQIEHTGPFRGTLPDVLYVLTTASPERGGGDFPYVADVTGRWAGQRVVVLGDYTCDADLPGVPAAGELYDSLDDAYTDITDLVRTAVATIFGIVFTSEDIDAAGHTFTLWRGVDPNADDEVNFFAAQVAQLPSDELLTFSHLVANNTPARQALRLARDVHAHPSAPRR